MEVFVTGNNFLVKLFEEKYAKRHNLVFADRVNLANLSELSAVFKAHKFDVVLHLGAKQPEEQNAAEDNLIIFRNLQYQSVLNRVPKLLYCILGEDRLSDYPVFEADEDELESISPAQEDMFGRVNYSIYGLAAKDKITSVLRLGYVYGKYQTSMEGFVGAGISSVLLGRKAKKIRVPYERTVSFTYADDTIKLLGKFVEEEFPKGSYNVVSDERATYLDAASLIQKAGKRYEKIAEVVIEEDILMPQYTLDNAKLKQYLTDMEFVSLKNGINRLFKMYSEDKSLIQNAD